MSDLKLRKRREAALCDNCKYYSYNDPMIKDKNQLLAWCNKKDRATVPWGTCGKFKLIGGEGNESI